MDRAEELKWFEVDAIMTCDVRFRVCAPSEKEARRRAPGKHIKNTEIMNSQMEVCDVTELEGY